MQRIVHFDLKGAPLKLPYFEQVLHCIKSWGGTGVLLEWEDTFPYSGNLSHLGSESNAGGDEMYDIQAIQHIFTLCEKMGLQVIQLVQTIGHLEFVLKHPCHKHLREYERSPSIICPDKLESRALVKQMVMQALAVQPDAKYFHIGADEVCHIAYCENCRKKIKTTHPINHWRIYLDYIRELVLFIRQHRPNIIILMWDDMIRGMTPEVLEEYRDLSPIVQLMVWKYEGRDNFSFPPDMWLVYNRYFPVVWAASAFKGANGSNQMISPVSRYVNNQVAWINQIRLASSLVHFAGIVFTGWSRYDHFATLCELLPTSMNSLANCLKCFSVGTLDNYTELHRDDTLPEHEWPGKEVAECVQRVAAIQDGFHRLMCGDLRMTWMNSWQLENGFLNMFQVDNIENFLHKLLIELKYQEEIASKELSVIFGPRTCDEWLYTYVKTIEAGLVNVRRTIKYARKHDPLSTEYAFRRDLSTTEQDISMTQQALSTTKQESSTEQLPSTNEPVNSITEQESLITEQMPSTTQHLPSTTDQLQLINQQLPSTTDQMQSINQQLPSTTDQMQSINQQLPSTTDQMQSINQQLPSTTDHMQSINQQLPSTTDQMQSINQQLPSTTDQMQSINQQLPSTTEQMPSIIGQLNSMSESYRSMVTNSDE